MTGRAVPKRHTHIAVWKSEAIFRAGKIQTTRTHMACLTSIEDVGERSAVGDAAAGLG